MTLEVTSNFTILWYCDLLLTGIHRIVLSRNFLASFLLWLFSRLRDPCLEDSEARRCFLIKCSWMQLFHWHLGWNYGQWMVQFQHYLLSVTRNNGNSRKQTCVSISAGLETPYKGRALPNILPFPFWGQKSWFVEAEIFVPKQWLWIYSWPSLFLTLAIVPLAALLICHFHLPLSPSGVSQAGHWDNALLLCSQSHLAFWWHRWGQI